ncbi:MAG: hypothetical protein JW727_04815 [Candidatus Aenigmarchaeota archaeon]|nr:hypothetical protein [Candidatus Aenigmarchaeota archaeon]
MTEGEIKAGGKTILENVQGAYRQEKSAPPVVNRAGMAQYNSSIASPYLANTAPYSAFPPPGAKPAQLSKKAQLGVYLAIGAPITYWIGAKIAQKSEPVAEYLQEHGGVLGRDWIGLEPLAIGIPTILGLYLATDKIVERLRPTAEKIAKGPAKKLVDGYKKLEDRAADSLLAADSIVQKAKKAQERR